VATFLFSPTPVVAQDQPQGVIEVDASVIRVGDTVHITYSNPDKAGETVVVKITNGDRRNPETFYFDLVLDEFGQASLTWDVPDWRYAIVDAPDTSPAIVLIYP
jgi:hypothetical protein